MVEPVHPVERGEFHSLQRASRSLASNHLRLEEPNHGLGEGVIVRISAAPDRRLDPGVREPFGVAHREILLGFKGSSQRVCVSSSLSDFEVPLRAFSSRVSFAADC